MATEFITIKEYCVYHHTDESFIEALQQSGLIEIEQAEALEPYIPYDQLEQLERFTRWYNELDLNVQGIEVVGNLLQKMAEMQQHILELETKLKKYEE
jgi:chaperone modulatory protein CbpM